MAKPVQIQRERESRRSRRRSRRRIAWKCVLLLLLCTMQLLTSKVMRSKQEQHREGSGAKEEATGDATSKGTEPFSKSSSEDAVRESEAKREMRMLLLLEKEQGEVIIERLCCAVCPGAEQGLKS